MRIQLSDVCVRYGMAPLSLAHVSLCVSSGEIIVILGQSGSGKTTLLRCVAGLTPPDSGGVHIDGIDMESVAPSERHLSMIQQSLAIPPHMTVERYISYWPKVRYGMSSRDALARAHEAAEQVGIERLLKRYTTDLSGGERQRAAFAARVLVVDEPIILMDEPLSSLDVPLKEELVELLRSILSKRGTTVLYVTHDRYEAQKLADRIALMEHGRIVDIGTYQELSIRSNSTFLGVSA